MIQKLENINQKVENTVQCLWPLSPLIAWETAMLPWWIYPHELFGKLSPAAEMQNETLLCKEKTIHQFCADGRSSLIWFFYTLLTTHSYLWHSCRPAGSASCPLYLLSHSRHKVVVSLQTQFVCLTALSAVSQNVRCINLWYAVHCIYITPIPKASKRLQETLPQTQYTLSAPEKMKSAYAE